MASILDSGACLSLGFFMASYMAIVFGEVMPEYSIAEAKNHLPQLVREAEAGQDVRLTRRGKPVATLISMARRRELTAARRSFWEAYQGFRREYDLAALEIDPDEVYGNVRDQSGRVSRSSARNHPSSMVRSRQSPSRMTSSW